MVRNWHPDVERTTKGFLKNLSVVSRVDAFTGEAVGSPRIGSTRQQIDESATAASVASIKE